MINKRALKCGGWCQEIIIMDNKWSNKGALNCKGVGWNRKLYLDDNDVYNPKYKKGWNLYNQKTKREGHSMINIIKVVKNVLWKEFSI